MLNYSSYQVHSWPFDSPPQRKVSLWHKLPGKAGDLGALGYLHNSNEDMHLSA